MIYYRELCRDIVEALLFPRRIKQVAWQHKPSVGKDDDFLHVFAQNFPGLHSSPWGADSTGHARGYLLCVCAMK